MAASTMRARRHKVFRSVFQADVSQPTPLLASSAPGEPFGGPQAHTLSYGQAPPAPLLPPVSDQVRWDRAWHVVTSRIQLPASVAVEDSFGTLAPESQDFDSVFHDSLVLLLNPGTAAPGAAHTDDILLWHTQQVRQHFVHHVLPLLAACAAQGGHQQVLLGSIQTLEAAHRQYLYGLTLLVRGIEHDAAHTAAVAKFRRDLHAIIGNSWAPGLTTALRSVLSRLLAVILHVGGLHSSSKPPASEEASRSAARDELLGLLESLNTVGLAGDKFHVLIAEVMDSCMRNFVHETYSHVWTTREASQSLDEPAATGCLEHLCDWVEGCYGHLAVEVFSRIGGHVSWNDINQWRDIAVGRLATLRIQELFDIVLHWPDSKGGLEDLRSAVATPQRRLQLTDTFSATLQKRLLHPGRSTLDILQTYISMIRTFHALDASKVLLDRVVQALQLYLCQRDDAIRIVVTGLLSNPGTADTGEDKGRLAELAVMLNDASQQQRSQTDDDDLDWNDMSWVPDPVDAGVNYKRPKNEDVIGTLINALGAQDIFIKEFQLIIAERLLSGQATFQQEIKVLGLLKKRYGENALQNCDVMIKDIHDSRRVDATLRKGLRSEAGVGESVPTYHSKILSRLFWPSLAKEGFQVPPPIAAIQERYEAGFEQLKSSRKLSWLDQLGSATVQLELEDRSVELECKTYEAAVIYAFQDDGSSESAGPQQRTFNEIWGKLMIDEDLLELALKFWVSKKVLRDVGNQTYTVLERLDGEVSGATNDEAGGAPTQSEDEDAQPSTRKAKTMDAKEQERRTVYWQFIVGMLTNSSPAMPLGQIAMMMKMLIADGCPWSNEELQEFLGEKVAGGDLELAGGKYRLPKK
ncbi:DNA polymerase delta processivity factor [Purpureocillium lavendulum]|uniref:Anaphase-promoting complex subunit 2 n=1 Tax=Purpureocillium lavendulum TaxID=1247861 RepID=A0AB34G2L8_9HYPO|nr:DNA polymerase delta processivity factor [Purpureocillium lavendulum]